MEDLNKLEKVKDRIAKLLRMAEDSSSPHEAAIAATRARKLMDQYQVTEADLANGIDEDFEERDVSVEYLRFPKFIECLYSSVGTYNDCRSVFTYHSRRRNGRWQEVRRIAFQGYKSDVILAEQMINMLLAVMNTMSKGYLAGTGRYCVKNGTQFKVGFMEIVSDRLNAMTKERDKLAYSGGTSLVLSKGTALVEYFGEVGKQTFYNMKVPEDDLAAENARLAGHSAGRMVEITKTVEMGNSPE